jgi:hypothetical protein
MLAQAVTVDASFYQMGLRWNGTGYQVSIQPKMARTAGAGRFAPQIIYRDHPFRVQFLPVFPGCFVDSANRMPKHESMRAGS